MSPIYERQRDEEQETVEEQDVGDKQKATGRQTLTILGFLLGMLVGTIMGFILTGNPTTDAPAPKGQKKKKRK